MSDDFHSFILQNISKAELNDVSQKLLKVATTAMNENASILLKKNEAYIGIETLEDVGGRKRTIVYQLSHDLPFMVDSFIACVNAFDLRTEHILHEAFFYTPKGDRVEYHSKQEEGDQRGEFVYAELSRVMLPQQAKALKEQLSVTAEDVALSTQDWQPMLAKAQESKAALGTFPDHMLAYPVSEYQEFMQYMHDDSFTFLGYRYYSVTSGANGASAKMDKASGLGLLRKERKKEFISSDYDILGGDLTRLLRDSDVMIIGKMRKKSTVHRAVPMDVVIIKHYNNKGDVTGIHLFLGLFTSITYSRSISTIPFLRHKVANVVEQMGYTERTHNYRALTHILEKYPRDELFQMQEKTIVEYTLKLMNLQECQKIAMFPRRDIFRRYISCLVYIPRMVFDAKLRMRLQRVLEESFGGLSEVFHTTMDDSVLVRVSFVIVVPPDTPMRYDYPAIEERLIEEGQTWQERLADLVRDKEADPVKSLSLIERYQEAFPASYRDSYVDYQALHDIKFMQQVIESGELKMDLYCRAHDEAGYLRLKLYHPNNPVVLSDIMPILTNMGLRVVSESPHKISPQTVSEETQDADKSVKEIWVQDLLMQIKDARYGGVSCSVHTKEIKGVFEDAFYKLWNGRLEDDALNALIVLSKQSGRDVMLLRGYVHYLRQIRYSHARSTVISALTEHADIAAAFVKLFKARFDPEVKASERDTIEAGARLEIDHLLDGVQSIEYDRIFRTLLDLVMNTLRTNFFQKGHTGKWKPYISYKIKSRDLADVPAPKPWVEIFVYAANMEGVHLRGGRVARGGLRWSDRQDDFRTEILGLMKAQTVKNAVIIPVGSKGGFVLKNLPANISKEDFKTTGIAAYKRFISGLLDITDNYKGKKVVPPKDVVRYDDNDPYLVVAADKGTATFSDIANGLSKDYGFWLGDAFASGGSAGYDHKKMGITARGAWEAVKRHFRELGKDIQNEPFDVIGVGDMAGDVFGNGMLLSKHIHLVGAFNHLHIFCDPNPDPKTSFKERQRLFDAVQGWDGYNTKLLSNGGRIYNRSDKTLTLTPQIKKRFGIDEDKVPPYRLIRAMLRAETDLLWFGGIGTYIKAEDETDMEVSDKANDLTRANAKDIKAKVIGEGANLALTHKGRIEFNQAGGFSNTDFIDNSAGVNSSDMEVNIKIALLSSFAFDDEKAVLTRNKLLESMTEDVAQAVLQNNYQQSQAISVMAHSAHDDFTHYLRLISEFEKRLDLDRRIEYLPSKEQAEIRRDRGKDFTRAELSTMFCYSKIMFYNDLLDSDIPDLADSEAWLIEYFPEPLRKNYLGNIKEHSLRREIIATQITNSVVNRLGPAVIYRCMERTGARASDVVRAYLIVRQMCGLAGLWQEIESLDSKLPASMQLFCFREIQLLVEHIVLWFLSRPHLLRDVEKTIKDFKSGYEALVDLMPDVLASDLLKNYQERYERYQAQGLTKKMAKSIALTQNLVSCPDMILLSMEQKTSVSDVAKLYYETGFRLRLVWLRNHARAMSGGSGWEEEALRSLIDELFAAQFHIVKEALASSPKKSERPVLEQWLEKHDRVVGQYDQLMDDLKTAPTITLAMLVTVGQRIRSLLG